MMFLRICSLIGAWAVVHSVPQGAIKCYDCNYDPKLLEGVDANFDWAANPNRGFPRCALHYGNDQGLVADTTCQGTCFIRKDKYNDMVYRGCADSWNLPHNVDSETNCSHSDDGSVWWFCTGSHCNRGTFGENDICPNYSADEGSEESSKSYGDENVYTRVDAGSDGVYDDIKYTDGYDGYDEQFYNYDTADSDGAYGNPDPAAFNAYRVMETGWQDYISRLEPKSSAEDDRYPEPAPYNYQEATYTDDPPQPIDIHPVPVLINPVFEEHYRSLIPEAGSERQSAFEAPSAVETKKSYDHQSAKSWEPKTSNHKSWEGDEYSVSSPGQNYESVKSTYSYTDHSKSYQPAPAPKSEYDNGQTQTAYQLPKSDYAPQKIQPPLKSKSHPPVKSVKSLPPLKSVKSQPPVKSVKSIPPVKSVKSQPPIKSVKSQPVKSVKSLPPVKSVKSLPPLKSIDVLPPLKSFEPPSKKSYQPSPKSIEPPSKKSYQPPQKSIPPPPKKSHLPPPKSIDLPSKKSYPPLKSIAPPSKKSSYQPPPKSIETPSKKSHQPPPKSIKSPSKKSHQPPPKSIGPPPSKKSHDPPPPPPPLVHIKSLPPPVHQAPIGLLDLPPPRQPELSTADFGDFWYDNFFRGEREPGQDFEGAPPPAATNPCDSDCSRNPSGLYAHPSREDWFIQCGAGLGDHGSYCSCCKPNYLRCPEGTSFDVNTRVCSTMVESYGYKPIY